MDHMVIKVHGSLAQNACGPDFNPSWSYATKFDISFAFNLIEITIIKPEM